MFTIAKTWKRLKCPTTEKWIRKMWCVYTHTHTFTHTHTLSHTHIYIQWNITHTHTHTYTLTHIYIYTMEYYSHTYTHTHTHIYIHNGILFNNKKNEIMSFVAPWMNLEIMILSGISQEER